MRISRVSVLCVLVVCSRVYVLLSSTAIKPEFFKSLLQISSRNGRNFEEKIKIARCNAYFCDSKLFTKDDISRDNKKLHSDKKVTLEYLIGLNKSSDGLSGTKQDFLPTSLNTHLSVVKGNGMLGRDSTAATERSRSDPVENLITKKMLTIKRGSKEQKSRKTIMSKRFRMLYYDCISYHCKGLVGDLRNLCIINRCNRQ